MITILVAWLKVPQVALLSLTLNRRGDMYCGITQSGWMFKRGAIVKSDKKRFFTLQGHTLFYFADDSV
jgi:hypothetical protein